MIEILVLSYLILWIIAVVIFFVNFLTKIAIRQTIIKFGLSVTYHSVFLAPNGHPQQTFNKVANSIIKAHFYFAKKEYVLAFMRNYFDVIAALASQNKTLVRLTHQHILLSRIFILLFNLNVILLLLLWMFV